MDSLLQFDVDVLALPLITVPVLLMAGKVPLLFLIDFAIVAAAAGNTLRYCIGRHSVLN